ncbi:TRAP transporter small permease [Desulfofundulus salinus]|jgi:C4-dicarboxylate transporter DctQ subunit|uniref:TRAP transporter small permease n=1 Tax=Desulfofundulus salinus TaxID=2419843 RepID=A0A494WZ15_9FIRM|nr:TRAP transporter small permease [Desulfofundulus salinum]RKO65784.1 TRAP transporter small permease [Desulfofundulus salinum]
MLDRIEKIIKESGSFFAGLLLSAMTVVVFLQVVFRFVIKGSLPWSEELARYLMVWATFIGAGLAAANNAHIGVEFFVKLFGPRASKLFLTLTYLVVMATSLVLVNYSWVIVNYQIKTGQVSPAMAIPMVIPYLALPVGIIYMAICFTLAYCRNIKNF